ncbi:MAG: hypothetical protein HC838_03725 [Spirulinaceae cyanobacterium RM2_2_10]|nr:hypothetical protein [Spirulinaceae cyanobacterium SM2_1_0]NJO19352.1 hypothetical protein [Spirulinaceae cyanobacterium RM2_2_10]
MSGLGVIQGKDRGLMQHNVLLIDDGGLPLGVIDQQYWTRAGAMDWPASQKESQKWFNGLAAVNQQAQGSNQRWVVACDRESDIFDCFKAPRESNVELLVRVFTTPSGRSRHGWGRLPIAHGLRTPQRLRSLYRAN